MIGHRNDKLYLYSSEQGIYLQTLEKISDSLPAQVCFYHKLVYIPRINMMDMFLYFFLFFIVIWLMCRFAVSCTWGCTV